MRSSAVITLLWGVALAHALPEPVASLLHPEAPITWVGQVERGGPNLTFTGTHKEVAAKIKALNPYWQREWHVTERSDMEAFDERDVVSPVYCNNGFAQGNSADFQTGYNYINYVYGDNYCYTEPKACARFACSHNSAILMCNDDTVRATIPCRTLGNEAERIYKTCSNNGANARMEGQQFYNKPNQNTLLKGTDPGNDC